MIRIILILSVFVFIAVSCNDSFNDPNPDYEEIIDNTEPTIELLSLSNDSVYYSLDTLNVRVRYTDDYLLDVIRFDMVPLNVTGASLKLNLKSTDSVYMIDTFYLVPAGDTVELDVLTICTDYAGNVSSKSLQVKVIK